MAYSTRPYSAGYSSYGHFTNGVKWLLISNITLFVLYYFGIRLGFGGIFEPFNLVPNDVLRHFAVWQLVTYMFLHDPFGFMHILINMLSLWMFGSDLERMWGTRNFVKFYMVCGVGAGVCVVILNALFGNVMAPTIGASGAIYGLLLAFGILFPERTILFMLLFPMKAKYAVAIYGAIAFLSSFDPRAGGVSHFAHLGGMLVGYIYLRSRLMTRRRTVRGRGFLGNLEDRYKEYRLQRAKRKFQVYLKKQQDSDRDRWVH